MRNSILIFILLLLTNSCINEPSVYGEQWVENKLKQKVQIFTYSRFFNQGNISFILIPDEKRLITNGRYYESLLNGTDSTIMVFADGKVKTDVFDNFPPSNPINIYNIELYRKGSCGRKCKSITYAIDEKDYAEAK